ncbi:acetylhydrolase [Agaricicola taiwanensis]|uniref:Acetylhydrolase n=2 Tax=Agaricicola taiwanensis TaxID=591372 RepID=A0A8J2YLL8_9RHOB|nr:acetylhydrolase [Agaricicola taiwanensis]
MLAQVPASRTPVARVEDRRLPSPDGEVAVRIYWPDEAPRGCLVFLHGGGFVMGGLDTHDHVCRDLCAGAQSVVVAVDYRLAPEHPFPCALNDCEAALRWVVANAREIGTDPRKIVVGGDSAGGNLATVLTMRARDRREPKLAGQILIYPVTDAPLPFKPSYIANGSGYSLTSEDMIRFWRDYVGDSSDETDPEMCPLRAQYLGGLPDALVITAEFDPLRDEGEAYANRLMSAGIPTTLTRYDGAIHGFVRMGTEVRLAAHALQQICLWMTGRFTAGKTGGLDVELSEASGVATEADKRRERT